VNDPNVLEGTDCPALDTTHRDCAVRRKASKRVGAEHLRSMMEDPDWVVRCNVARRLDPHDALLMHGIERDPYIKGLAFRRAFSIDVEER
jgi:hypothetical protein